MTGILYSCHFLDVHVIIELKNKFFDIVIAVTSYFKPTIFDRVDFIQKYIEPFICLN